MTCNTCHLCRGDLEPGIEKRAAMMSADSREGRFSLAFVVTVMHAMLQDCNDQVYCK